MNIWENVNFHRIVVVVLGSLIGLLGGYDLLLSVLLVAVALDIFVGTGRAYLNKSISVDVAFRGGFRKLGIFIAVALATLLDRVISPTISTQLLRTAAAAYYIAVEGVSITEHLVALGVPLPPVLVEALAHYTQEKLNAQEDHDARNSGVTGVSDAILTPPEQQNKEQE